MTIYTKESLIARLKDLAEEGFIKNHRYANSGGIGNTLEDYLGITENNLAIPNAAEWELKAQRLNTTALTTLFHLEPSPRAAKLVPNLLLPVYGWQHKEAGSRYSAAEMSFRQTIHCLSYSDRGFIVKVDRDEQKVVVSFDASKVDERHEHWLSTVNQRIGLGELRPQPYWGFSDLQHKAGTKLLNCFYVQAAVKREADEEYYWYNKVQMLRNFSFVAMLNALERGLLLIDFDARTGHNHGTKFRMRQTLLPLLYESVETIFDFTSSGNTL